MGSNSSMGICEKGVLSQRESCYRVNSSCASRLPPLILWMPLSSAVNRRQGNC